MEENLQVDRSDSQTSTIGQKLRTYLSWKYVKWCLYGFIVVIVLILLMDNVVMPLYTKHGEEYTMPDVTNLPFREAERILKEQGFRPILDTLLYSKTIPDSFVISQNPRPGVIVKSNRRTYLTISKGEKWIRAPKLVGISERAAEVLLRQNELVPGEVHYEFSSFYPKGVVSGQSVPVGDSIMVGDTIHIQISLGDMPEYLTVPNLIGKSFEEAKKILEENGFILGLITYQVNNDLLPNTVIQQQPAAETMVDVGTQIDLILSQIQEQGGWSGARKNEHDS